MNEYIEPKIVAQKTHFFSFFFWNIRQNVCEENGKCFPFLLYRKRKWLNSCRWRIILGLLFPSHYTWDRIQLHSVKSDFTCSRENDTNSNLKMTKHMKWPTIKYSDSKLSYHVYRLEIEQMFLILFWKEFQCFECFEFCSLEMTKLIVKEKQKETQH